MGVTVAGLIDKILDRIPGGRLDETVDTVKCGDPTQEVTGIVTTFIVSQRVIERAVALGANFIITHESTFYNHLDAIDTLADDPVYQEKCRLLDEHGIVIWRFHDHWHRHDPDGIVVGVIRALGWDAYAYAYVHGGSPVITIPETTVGDLARYVKRALDIDTVRVVGDPAMPCRNVSLMVGAPPAQWQIAALGRDDVDVMLAGEVREWETSEYARDAVLQGRQKALIVLGHAKSEEPGMAYLVEWLQPLVPGVPITYVPVGDAFIYL